MSRKQKHRLAVVEYVAVLLATGTLFAKAVDWAAAQRGYSAVGGEFAVLLLPILYYIIKKEIRDYISFFRDTIEQTRKRKPPLP